MSSKGLFFTSFGIFQYQVAYLISQEEKKILTAEDTRVSMSTLLVVMKRGT